jgi:dihydroorotate dehydrogenase electron transfer subunit
VADPAPDTLERATGEPRTLAPPGRRRAEVSANEEVGAYRLIRVDDRDGPPDPRPGQFYMLATAEAWGGAADERPYLPRAFSFARARRGHTASSHGRSYGEAAHPGVQLEFLLEEIGPGTERLGAVEPGADMLLTGPLGVGFRAPGEGVGAALLVGGGIGAAPILCWHDELGPKARLALGFRSAEHAEAARLFAGDPMLTTDDGSAGRHGLVTEILREELDGRADGRPAPSVVYACGPPPMLEAVRAVCAERDVSAQLALESGMACGYGACFGCVVPTRSGLTRLCVEGPVLAAAELATAAAPGTGH